MGIYLVEAVDQDGMSVIVKFRRTEDGKKIIEYDEQFKPYFYIDESEKLSNEGIISIESGFKTIFGNKVKKVVVTNSRLIPELRKKVSRSYEADILFSDRYLIDYQKELKKVPLKVLSLDIEVDDTHGFPDIDKAEEAITCISVIDNFSHKTKTWIWREDFKFYSDKELHKFSSEKGMLFSFLNYFKETSPDILTAWNLPFDLTYLINRCERLGVQYKQYLSPLNMVSINKQYKDIKIKGLVTIDALTLYKHFRKISNLGELRSYTLDFVSHEELGKGKLKFDESFTGLWNSDWKKLVKYNRIDAELVLEILERRKIIEFYDSIRRLSHCQFDKLTSTGAIVESFLLHRYHNKYVFPNKPRTDGRLSSDNPIQGAIVKEPTPGLFENVLVLDLASLYPSIIRTFNISIETYRKTKQPDLIHVNKTTNYTKSLGIIPETLEVLLKERKKYKKKLKEAIKNNDKENIENYNHMQYGVKVLANTMYGFCLFPNSRVFKRENGEAITELARKTIMWSGKIVEEAGYDVIYSDSVVGDSEIIVRYPDGTIEKGPISLFFGEPEFRPKSDKEISYPNLETLTIDKNGRLVFRPIRFMIRKKIKKNIMRLHFKSGRQVGVTLDHSLMVKRKGKLLALPPRKVKFTDTFIGLAPIEYASEVQSKYIKRNMITNERLLIKEEPTKYDGYVYDIEVSDTHMFFANGILVHNTDSLYVKSKSKSLLNMIREGKSLRRKINKSYDEFVKQFNCEHHYLDMEFESILKSILFIPKNSGAGAKKLYAYKEIWSDGQEIKPKLKIKGLSSRRCLYKNTKVLIKPADSNMIQAWSLFDLYRYGVEGKEILTEDGFKPIKRIIKQRRKRYIEILTETGRSIKCTETHKFLIRKQKDELMLPANNLRPGDLLPVFTNGTKQWEEIIKIYTRETEVQDVFYDIEVDSAEHLFVTLNGIITHNSDSAELTKEIQLKTLDMILDGKPKEEIIGFLQDIRQKILNGKIPLEALGIPKGLTKKPEEYNPPMAIHKGILYSNKYLGTRYGKGDKIKYIYIKRVPEGLPDSIKLKIPSKDGTITEKEYKIEAIAFDEKIPEGFEVDIDRMLEKTFKDKLTPIFRAMKWDFFFKTEKDRKRDKQILNKLRVAIAKTRFNKKQKSLLNF